jgi:hypothetical protein
VSEFHVVTVGWGRQLIDGLWADIAVRSQARFSHVVHPAVSAAEWKGARTAGIRFFREAVWSGLPAADTALLASLERDGVPTIHNMILGDRVVSRLPYEDARRYATFIAGRLLTLFGEMRPSVVIGGFDSLHSGLALAVSRRLGIPWRALHFSVLPPGLACFCDGMNPAARVTMAPRPREELRTMARSALAEFEDRKLRAAAYIAPARSPVRSFAMLPQRAGSLLRTLRRSRERDFARFTDPAPRYDAIAALRSLRRLGRANRALDEVETLATPPAAPFVLFALHMQPESSIDVWAPFFSNQMWVVELLSRSIPASHRLLVKIHKSDVSNHDRPALERMRMFPGVELVRPFVDSREFVEKADLVVAIQGTIGLEAALLGKPVIMLGESPVTVFPTAVRAGALAELPGLVRSQIARPRASRGQVEEAFADYLAPFMPAGSNHWGKPKSEAELEGFARMFDALREHLLLKGLQG